MAVVEFILDIKPASWVTGNTTVLANKKIFWLDDGSYGFGDGVTQVQNLPLFGGGAGSFVPLSTKDQANGYVGLDLSKQISLSASIAGAYIHEFINSNASGFSYFRTSNNVGKEAAIVVFGSAGGVGSLYLNNTSWLSGTADSVGIVNEQAAGKLIFATGGAGSANVIAEATITEFLFNKQLKIIAGSPAAGKVLTSDSTGLASWTNKSRAGSITSSATPSINVDTFDFYRITSLAANITTVTISGTPYDGQAIKLSIKDNGLQRAVDLSNIFFDDGGGSPIFNTTLNKKTTIGAFYDSSVGKFGIVAIVTAS